MADIKSLDDLKSAVSPVEVTVVAVAAPRAQMICLPRSRFGENS